MRRIIFVVLFIAMFVAACSNSQNAIQRQENVRIFSAMSDDVKYSETEFSGEGANAVADLVTAECPKGVGDTFVRATLETSAATLIVYATPDGKNITCSLLKPKEQKEVQIKPQSDAPDRETIMLVNGKPITRTQVQLAVASLPQGTKLDENTTVLILTNLVNQELLRQEAEKMEATDAEIAQARAKLLAQANVTEAQLAGRLAAQNATVEAFDKGVTEQVKLDKLFKKRLLSDELNVSEEAARGYYLQNTNQFIQSEQAIARYVIISSQVRSKEQAARIAQEVAGKLNTTDFCTLVTRYSDDNQSKGNCGIYVVPRGILNPDLESASFGTPANQTSLVTTDAGIYFVQTLQVTPAQVVPYSQVAGNLQTSLRDAVLQQRLNLYLTMLRSNAEIVSYLG